MAEITDFHVMVGDSIQGDSLTVDELIAEMTRLSIARAILCPVRPYSYDYTSSNDLVADARNAHPGRFHAFGRIDARQPEAALEAERCLGRLQMDGLYLHPWEDNICAADHRFDPILEVLQRHRAPVLIATGYPLLSEALQVADLAGRFPDVKVVMTNGGQINISGLGQRSAWLALQNHENLYITTSGVYREDFLEEVATQLGGHRLVFASQAPQFDMDFELHRVLWAHVDEGLKDRILHQNAAAVLARG